MMEIFRLLGSIFIDNDPANRAIDATDKKAQGLAGTLGSGIATAAKWAAGIAGAVGGVVLLANSTASAADKIDKMSIRTGISRTRLQELQFVTGQTGVSFESLQNSIARMTQTMGRADAEGKAAMAAFARLGVAVHDASGELRATDVVFNETLLALAEMENKTERNVLAQQIFGKGAIELVPLLDAGADGIAELTARAHELGLVMSDEAIRAGVEYADAMDELKRSMGALKNDAMLALMPVIKDVAAWLTDLIAAFRSLTPEQQKTIVTIGGLVLAGGPLIKMLTGAKNMVEGVGKAFGWLSAPTPLSPIQMTLLAVGALIAIGVLLYQNWDTIKAKAQEIWAKISGIIKGAIDGITGWIDGFIGRIQRAIDWVRNLLGLNREAAATIPAAPTPLPAPGEAEVPAMATGGIITRPALAWVGEKGPEAVLPLDPLRAGTARIEALLQAILTALRADRAPDLEGLFKGATIQVRNDQDVRRLAQEIYALHASRARAAGVALT